MSKVKENLRPLGAPNSWAKTPGTYIAAHAHMDGVDALAIDMEQYWGVGRLRLLVDPGLRERFDRQRYLLNQAVWHGDLESVRRESFRMAKAWAAVDQSAKAAGAVPLAPVVWEATMASGDVLAVVRDDEDAKAVVREGRAVVVFTMSELATMVENYRQVVEVKSTWPGATVEAVRRPTDPLDKLADSDIGLDDPLPNLGAGPLQ